MRMTNTPADYQLNTPATALDFINQAQAWLEEAAVTAARVAANAAEEAAAASSAAAKADRVVEAFKTSPTIALETLTLVEKAAATLVAAAKRAEEHATTMAAEAEAFAAAVEIATTLKPINSWAEIK